MIDKDLCEIKNSLRHLATFFPHARVADPTLDAWTNKLSKYPLSIIKTALGTATTEFDRFPSLSAIISLVRANYAPEKKVPEHIVNNQILTVEQKEKIFTILLDNYHEGALSDEFHKVVDKLNTMRVSVHCIHCEDQGLVFKKQKGCGYVYKCFCKAGRDIEQAYPVYSVEVA